MNDFDGNYGILLKTIKSTGFFYLFYMISLQFYVIVILKRHETKIKIKQRQK